MQTIKIIFKYGWNGALYGSAWLYMIPSQGNTWVLIEDINEFLRENDLTDCFEFGGNYQEIESLSIDHWQTRYAIDCGEEF